VGHAGTNSTNSADSHARGRAVSLFFPDAERDAYRESRQTKMIRATRRAAGAVAIITVITVITVIVAAFRGRIK